jgi:Methyltransferase domain
MGWMAKVRAADPASSASLSARSKDFDSASAVSPRVSNGLKEFLWLASDTNRGTILDLGPAWQATLSFFAEKGYRITSDDLLRTWWAFLTGEEERLRSLGINAERPTKDTLAEQFLEDSLQYPEHSYNGILMWDLLDYFEPALATRMMARIYDMLRPGGVMLALFHSRPAERFHRYRVSDGQTIEMVPSPSFATQVRVLQNREIQDLFGKFRSSKTFVGRDQLREVVFLK